MAVSTVKRIDVSSRAGERTHVFPDPYGKPPRANRQTGAAHRYGPASIEVPGIGPKVHVKIASELDEFKGAFRLLATNYQACGYESRGAGVYRFTPYHVLPTTVTVVAKHENHVVATLSVVLDTEVCGLPMESVYGAEIDGLRETDDAWPRRPAWPIGSSASMSSSVSSRRSSRLECSTTFATVGIAGSLRSIPDTAASIRRCWDSCLWDRVEPIRPCRVIRPKRTYRVSTC